MKDLIIGSITNYDWSKVKCWVNSIKKTSFSGDIVLVATNISKETIDKLTEKGVILVLRGKPMPDGSYSQEYPNDLAPHVERFFHIWHYLDTTKENYRYVVTTDVRDVIFQENPFEMFRPDDETNLIFASEEMRYKDEPWGIENMEQAMGPFFRRQFENDHIFNVGVLAGKTGYVKSLLMMIFQLSCNRPIPVCDQAMFNFYIHKNYAFNNEDGYLWANNDNAWAIQLGTTREAVLAGAGRLGEVYSQHIHEYDKLYLGKQPVIDERNIVRNSRGVKFLVVHQYDRIPKLKTEFEKMYGED